MASHVNPDVSLGFALKRLQQVLRARMDAGLAEHGLTTPQYAVLGLLAEHPDISNAELARRSFVAAPTMIRIVGTLTEVGLISRGTTSAAERIRRTALTAAGRDRLGAASAHVQHLEDLLLAHAEPQATDIVRDWLRTCAEELEQS